MLRNIYRPHFDDFASNRALTIQIFLLGVLVTILYRPFLQAETGDQSIWDYMSQAILRGQIPYRDVIEIKSPLSAYLSAIPIFIGRRFGATDVLSIRAFYVVLVGVVAALTFSTAHTFLRKGSAGVIAVFVLLMSDHFVSWMISGTEPKLWMVIFGLVSLLLAAKNRLIIAGFCSMLACLCWQPGLLFTGTLVLVCSNYLTSWRDGRAVRVIIGAFIPLAVTMIYFAANHALSDLWQWTMAFNYRVYAPMTHKEDASGHLLMILLRVFKIDFWIVILGFAGLLVYIFQNLRSRFAKNDSSGKQDEASNDALWMPMIVYLLFCLINLQAGPDLIPLFPFIGIFTGFAIVKAARLFNNERAAFWLPNLVIALLMILTFWRGVQFWRNSSPQLRAQLKAVETINHQLNAEDKIYVHGATEILVLLNRPNATPYIFLDYGKDDYLAAQKGGNFDTILNEIEQQSPKIIVLSRLKKVQHKAELREWVEANYNRLEVMEFDDVFIRKS